MMWVERNIGTTDIFCRNVMVLAILFDNLIIIMGRGDLNLGWETSGGAN